MADKTTRKYFKAGVGELREAARKDRSGVIAELTLQRDGEYVRTSKQARELREELTGVKPDPVSAPAKKTTGPRKPAAFVRPEVKGPPKA